MIGKEKPGIGLGVRWEGNLIYQRIYNPGTINAKFIPVLLAGGQFDHIPTPVQGVTYYSAQADEGYDQLYRRLTAQPEHTKPELGKVRKLDQAKKLQPLEPKERKQDFFAAPLTNLPFERNPFFTGRDKILNDLHTAFENNGKTQAISGLGGLGKTQTAIEYAYVHRGEYQAVFWVRADSQLALSTGFVDIARLLNLPEKDAQNPDDAVRAVKMWLENNFGWLLICDNADAPEIVKRFRPHNAAGHILLTSRAQVFQVLGNIQPFEIDVMLPEEALKFLLTRTGRDDDNAMETEAAAQLASELGYLPLALEQAGAFITAKQARFRDYLTSYRKRRLELLNESRPVTGDYPESVATTWSINFGEVEKVSAAASDLLRVSAFLSPDSIPFELITNGRSELGAALSAALADIDEDPLILNNVFEPLTRYSFIRLDNDSQTYSIHRLVQEVLKDGMDEDTHRLWAEHTVRALAETFPEVEFKNWPLCERLLPQTKVGAKLIDRWKMICEEAARLLDRTAVYTEDRGQYAEAEPLYKRSLTIREVVFGPQHSLVASSLNNLAELYRVQGKYGEAEILYKRSLAIDEKELAPENTEVATTLNNLAVLYQTQGKYADAELLHQRSIAIKEKSLRPNHPSLARSLNNLAELYRRQGKYTDAEGLFERSMAMWEAELGQDHPDLAAIINNLALLYRAQGKKREAESLFERALAIDEKALWPDHPGIAVDLHNLASLYHDQGKDTEAELLYKRALEIFRTALGPEHPNVATVLHNYAALLRGTERKQEAQEMEARAEAIRDKYLPIR